MKILITGAAGGIGSSVAYYLNSKGHDLILLDNFRNGYKENLIINGSFFGKFYELDICDKQLTDKIKEKDIDYIIHLAAVTSLPDCELNAQEAFEINVNGTLNIINFAKTINCKHIIFASTGAVYENNKELIYSEELSTTPRLVYSLSKKMAEEICLSYNENYNMNICILRFFNVFGPRQDIYRKNPPLLNYIVKQIKNNQIINFHGDGNQKRDYIHIDDVINLIDICLYKQPRSIYNVCSGELLSVNDIFSYIAEELNYNKKPNYRPANMLWDTYPDLFKGNFCLDKKIVEKETNKYSKGSFKKCYLELGWSPNLNLKQLIKKTTKEIK